MIAQLTHLSRDELAEVEAYERSHRSRPAVLEALNYARQGGVDAATAKAVGDFERSVAGRRPGPEPAAMTAATSWTPCGRRRATSASGSTCIAPRCTAGSAVSDTKLRELQRGAEGAAARLKRAEDAGHER